MKKKNVFIIIITILFFGIFLLNIKILNRKGKMIIQQEKTPDEIAKKLMKIEGSSIKVKKTNLKPGESITVYIKKDIYPKKYAFILHSVDEKNNITGIDISKCVDPFPTPPSQDMFGCYITMPEKEGVYVFRTIAPPDRIMDESEKIIIKK